MGYKARKWTLGISRVLRASAWHNRAENKTLPHPKSGRWLKWRSQIGCLWQFREAPNLMVPNLWILSQSWGPCWHLRKDKGMSKAVQTNSPTQKNYDLYQKFIALFLRIKCLKSPWSSQVLLANNGLKGGDEPWACGRECSGPSMTYPSRKSFLVRVQYLKIGLESSKSVLEAYRVWQIFW